ncbi:rhodanese-like domain-containing protein [Seonamhaeicola maritimus]|uniref:rhodanese-like domain-containing protein n=1 Tax=Seonamhaeicola maritimus TaxID=2591822 RepID=UPI0024941A11|nr:rhodanese-like domain-containing protein [Seonamhaeicola maritimus]
MVNRKLVKFLSLRYKILAFIFIVLAGGLVLLPKYEKQEGISPEKLLSSTINPERYISTDALADRMINQDPALLLIDVRNESDFKKYTLTNAINIPLKNILDEESEPYLNQDAYDVVLFSNDHFHADQAWILCNRLGYKNLHVLNGGINNWYNTIINPKIPSEDMAHTEFELYAFRKAASMYFGVAYPEKVKKAPVKKPVTKPSVIEAPKKVIVKKKKKKMPIEGGC